MGKFLYKLRGPNDYKNETAPFPRIMPFCNIDRMPLLRPLECPRINATAQFDHYPHLTLNRPLTPRHV